MKKTLILLSFLLYSLLLFAQNIRTNQIGFHPSSYKIAIVPENVSGEFYIKDANSGNTVYTGTLGEAAYWDPAAANVRIADFSDFQSNGSFYVSAGAETSYEFDINETVLEDPTRTIIRGFYYWRSSSAIEEPYAIHEGQSYARALGHPDNSVMIDGAAASPGRPAGSTISSPKGWYDAGDYGKYIVSGAPAVYFLMTAWEQNKAFMDNFNLNIPESNNNLPDILDEAKWELDWFLSMQDPYDGGVYFKLTTGGFAGMSTMPGDDTDQRYVYAKSTAATLDFAAVMAVAYRIFINFDQTYANKCLQAAEYAWEWAMINDNIGAASGGTGQYEDSGFNDEFAWASNELYIATGNEDYYTAFPFLEESFIMLEEPSWQKTSLLGLLSLVNHLDELGSAADKAAIENKFMHFADSLCTIWEASAYQIMTDRYWWGINSVVGAQGIVFSNAYDLTGEERYLRAAISHMDYIFGRNPVGYSYVTWLGDKSPLHPHDRRANGDGINLPLPGYVVGGANPDCSCGGAGPALQYHDEEGDYAVNEVAVNYSGPMVRLMADLNTVFQYNKTYFSSALTKDDASIITLYVTEDIDPTTISNMSDFEIHAGERTISMNAISVDAENAKLLHLSLSAAIDVLDNPITISYSGTTISSVNGKLLVPFTDKNVRNELPGAPLKIESISMLEDAQTIIIELDKALAQVPAPNGGFSVVVNWFEVSLENISIHTSDNKKLEIALAAPIIAGDEISISFDGTGSVVAEDTGILLAFDKTDIENPLGPGIMTGFRDDFNDNIVADYFDGNGGVFSSSNLSENNDIMTIDCNGKTGYDQLIGQCNPLDITAAPQFEIRLKAANNFTLRVDLGHTDGGKRYTNANPVSVNVTGSSDFQTIVLEYSNWESSYDPGMVDPTKITHFNIQFNPGSGYNGTIEVDYIEIGHYVKKQRPAGAPMELQSASISAPSTIQLKLDREVGTVPTPPGGIDVNINGYTASITDISILSSSTDIVEIALAETIVSGDNVSIIYDGSVPISAANTGDLPAFERIELSNPYGSTGGNTGFADEFNDNSLAAVWNSKTGIDLLEEGETLTVSCNGVGSYNHVEATFSPIDISATPTIEIRLKADSDFTLRIDLGYVGSSDEIFTNCPGESEKSTTVTGDGSFKDITFTFDNWSGCYPSGTVDPKNISLLSLMFNPGSGYNGDVVIDYIRIGEISTSSEAKLSSISLSDGSSLVPDFSATQFSYTVALDMGASIPDVSAISMDPNATIQYNQANDPNGSATIEVTAADGETKRLYTILFNQPPGFEQTITLQNGWNLVTFYIDNGNTTIADFFPSDVLSEITIIKDNESYFNSSNPTYLNTLQTIIPGKAYLINCSSSQTFTIEGMYTTNTSYSLHAGWNMLGYPLPESNDIETSLQTIWTLFDIMKNFDGYFGKSEPVNSYSDFEPGKGYLIYVSEDCTISF